LIETLLTQTLCLIGTRLIVAKNNPKKHNLDNYGDVLQPEDIMAILQIGKNTVYELLKSGELRSLKIGKQYRIPKTFLQDYLYSCYATSVDSLSTRAKKGA